MKTLLSIILVAFGLLFLAMYCERSKDPYEEGMHLGYSIICENGFVYKRIDVGTIQVLNSDGTPLKCGQKIY
jgi:hypothetical protein